MSELRLNRHPVAGYATLELIEHRYTQIWAAITVGPGSPVHSMAQQAVLAGSLEVKLEGEAHDPVTDVSFRFEARGQLVNGRVGKEIKADFKSTSFVRVADAKV